MKHFTPSLFGLFHHQLGSRVQGVSHCRAMSTQASTGQESPPNFEMVSIRPGLDPEAQIYVTYRYNFLGRSLINLCSDILIIIAISLQAQTTHPGLRLETSVLTAQIQISQDEMPLMEQVLHRWAVAVEGLSTSPLAPLA